MFPERRAWMLEDAPGSSRRLEGWVANSGENLGALHCHLVTSLRFLKVSFSYEIITDKLEKIKIAIISLLKRARFLPGKENTPVKTHSSTLSCFSKKWSKASKDFFYFSKPDLTSRLNKHTFWKWNLRKNDWKIKLYWLHIGLIFYEIKVFNSLQFGRIKNLKFKIWAECQIMNHDIGIPKSESGYFFNWDKIKNQRIPIIGKPKVKHTFYETYLSRFYWILCLKTGGSIWFHPRGQGVEVQKL